MWMLASYVLAPAQDTSADAPKPDRDAVSRLRNGFRPGLRYWQQLDAKFPRFLEALVLPEVDEYGDTVFGGTAIPDWLDTVQSAALAAFDEIAAQLAETARAFKAVAVAQRGLNYDLRKLLNGNSENAISASEQKEAVR
jgi:hypothetical protein